jgi:ethanolamine ammonia-lyase small subunit
MNQAGPPMPLAGPGARLRTLTPARVGLGRAGSSISTRDLLDFERCHAEARDAVHARLESWELARTLGALRGGGIFRLHSAAADRATYLKRPDLGRRLDDPSRELLASHSGTGQRSDRWCNLAIIVVDGLSALAVERHAPALVQELVARLAGWALAPVSIVEQGRVAVGDEIGAALGAEISVVLIGERPGLSSPDSLGAYITWEPRPGRTDAERNCISNIRAEGLSYQEAAAQLELILCAARRQRLTGVALNKQAGLLREG